MSYSTTPFSGSSCADHDRSLAAFTSDTGKIDTFCSDRGKVNGRMYEETVQGYSPASGFFEMDVVSSLMIKPNLPRATPNNKSGVLRLPEKALILSASARHNGTALTHGGLSDPTFNIGTEAFGTESETIFAAATEAGINAGIAGITLTGSLVGTSGSVGLSNTQNYVTFTPKAASLTAGNVVVTITYAHIPNP